MVDTVDFVRYELQTALPRYRIIRDCIKQTVKARGELYLPKPNPTELTEANEKRYESYKERAIFYDVTNRTLGGMITQVFARDPEIKLPELLRPMLQDSTGTGLGLVQLSKDSTCDVVGFGRHGIYVDYPKTVNVATRADILSGNIQPTFTIYAPENIINWREEKRGGKIVKTLVVLVEMVDEEGAYSAEPVKQYRELRLTASGLRVTVFRDFRGSSDAAGRVVVPSGLRQMGFPEYPLQADGKPFTEIPFEFIGAMNNDSTIDEAPLYGMAELNIGHYRNSADYEEACFIAGQPTPWFSGLDEDWVENVFKGKVLLGTRQAIPLPENSQAGLLQVQPNIMPMEAMKHKEAQMVALGARLVENRQVRRTLGEVTQSSAAETSILAACANNVSAAYTRCLGWAAKFVGADPTECEYTLNTDFALTELSGQERAALIAEMQAGVLSWQEVRDRLRRGGLATQNDEEAKAAIDAELAAKSEREIAVAVATRPVVEKPAEVTA